MFTTRPEIAGTFGAVATTHWIASQVGMSVLERGGNAFDAACAAGFTLQIVEPHLNGPGGDCPIILHSAKTGTQQVICGQGPAPAAMTVAKLKGELGLDIVPGTGFLCAPIPGAFDAWALMLRDHGTWKLGDILAYAIGYAARGAHVVPRVCATIETVRPLFETAWPTSAALWLRPGGPTPGGVRKAWSWLVASGKNPAYDFFPCQERLRAMHPRPLLASPWRHKRGGLACRQGNGLAGAAGAAQTS